MKSNEPLVPLVARRSFFFVPTAGMRSAPEVLLLELFREVFFKGISRAGEMGGPRQRNLDPYAYPVEEVGKEVRAVLNAARGRRKRSSHAVAESYYAPAYPALASLGWFRPKEARVVKGFFLGGPLAQRFHGDEDRAHDFAKRFVKALEGHRAAAAPGNTGEREILSVAIAGFQRAPDEMEDDPVAKVLGFVRGASDGRGARGLSPSLLDGIADDPLAHRIADDLEALCQLEGGIPRLEWLRAMMSFLRLALPCWLLAQCRLAGLVRGWLVNAVEAGELPSPEEVKQAIRGRHLGLLHLRMKPTREVIDHVVRYMKNRVELHLLLYSLERAGLEIAVSGTDPGGERSRVTRITVQREGPGDLPVRALLERSRELRDRLKGLERYRAVAGDLPVDVFLAREGQQFAAWRAPRKGGQGKNLDEMLRVMYKDPGGEQEGGYLLEPVGRGASRGFRVFPGQGLLKLVVYLAHAARRRRFLVLRDVEEHFAHYGIDFSSVAEARQLLLEKLQALGLLRGSPDAGDSVRVACPYPARGDDE